MRSPENKPEEKKDESGNVWTTKFFLSDDPEDLKQISRILDTLRNQNTVKIDPKFAKQEAEELWGPEEDW